MYLLYYWLMENNIVTYQDMCQRARTTDMIHAVTDRLPSLLDETARSKEYADLAGDGYDPCQQRQREISHLIGRLKRIHAEIESLRRHHHEWGIDDYCMVCGADGRA